ncbi:3-methylitaconate isomerase-like protein [Emericellopsis cladophorae]|uniref:3-methylitaconate isomerase-like protein n=1 Tax=Emericellopsis cladophorae TaxID=2686198 RepID=A0A9P9XXQ4_9HYPO|nr:3-methylitaconate isomerase-like protein [Emericellopsis cladophorae]KAI6779757.1 3-methylitaconate isomerase-like protein [Emericellopsis cladophorae]
MLHTKPRTLNALFVRGGTSNGLMIHDRDLPPRDQWQTVLPAAMGSPDPYGRQLNGMGSGISSTSKVVVVHPPTRDDVDVEYTFVQVRIKDDGLDMEGNCGNMSSAVGPIAWEWGLGKEDAVETDSHGRTWASMRLLNRNTNKVIVARFRVEGRDYVPSGEYELDGVVGEASPITMSFMDPAGAKTGKALPSGNAVDELPLEDGSTIQATLMDVSNPGVFVKVADLGIDADALTPDAIEGDVALKRRLEQIRRAGATEMGLDPEVESIPKIILVFPSKDPSADIRCAALSMGQAHKAVPLTLALCLGAACQTPGTIPASLLRESGKEAVTIAHPSGKLDIGTTMRDGRLVSAELLRTARIMMKGEVLY